MNSVYTPSLESQDRTALAMNSIQEPSLNHSRPRLGWRDGTFSPSCRQMRSTHLWYTRQPSLAIVGLFNDTELTHDFCDCLTLGNAYLRLPEMANALFCRVTLPGHRAPLLCPTS